MKKQLILCMAVPLFLLGCRPNETEVTKVVIAGKVDGTAGESIDVFFDGDVASTAFEEDGSFYVSFEADEAAVYFLRVGVGDFSLFLAPGDSVFVTADGKEFKESFQLSGDRVVESTYLHQKNQFLYEELGDFTELFSLSKEAYFDKRSSFFDRQRERLHQLQAAHKLHPVFLKEEESYLDFEPFLYDSQYPHYQAYINEISLEEVDFPHDEIKAAFAAIDLGRSDLLVASSYRSVIERRVHEHANELLEKDSTLWGENRDSKQAIYLAVDELLENQSVRDFFMYSYIKIYLDIMGPEYVQDDLEKFKADNISPKLLAKLEKQKIKMEPIMPGNDIPDFRFIDIAGDSVQLSDLKGKLVYIDIWATWCGPCIAEHSHWDELRTDYQDKEVAFLSLSIDESIEPWQKMVRSKNLGGLQWFAENAWKSEITKHFMVKSIPRFLLLDQEGKIITSRAERPSGNIRSELDKHLSLK